ncbi:PEP-CTERM sorting domain-containing protein [Exilibacterium tricleocarpae]|uniref:PEP-CTERM sorting domain-containing protein n=1 Tax=Exilibacterium tricleocarpae TaxID=2591008 RepID=UPI0015D26375|nr:PEP-CTERM sorting domain-containing protein [Exilibacterium tricleocarpae]
MSITLLTFLASMSSGASALVIEYSTSFLGGDSYRYDYTITNDAPSGGDNVGLFSILFDTLLYDFSSLNIVSDASTASWEQSVLAPAIGVPAAFDFFALDFGLGAGETAAGFAIEFDWLGDPGDPAAQLFEVYDPFSFALLDVGTTIAAMVPVSEPRGLLLLLLGLGALLYRRRARAAG